MSFSKRRSALKSHSLSVHKIKEIYYCDQCNKGFEYQKALFEHHESVHVEDEESETSDSESDVSINSVDSIIEIKEELDEKAVIDLQMDVKEEDVLAQNFLDISKFKEVEKVEDEILTVNILSGSEPLIPHEESDDDWAGGDNWGQDWSIDEEPEPIAIKATAILKRNIGTSQVKQPDLIFNDGPDERLLYPFKCPERDCKARLKTKKLLLAHAVVHKVKL